MAAPTQSSAAGTATVARMRREERIKPRIFIEDVRFVRASSFHPGKGGLLDGMWASNA